MTNINIFLKRNIKKVVLVCFILLFIFGLFSVFTKKTTTQIVKLTFNQTDIYNSNTIENVTVTKTGPLALFPNTYATSTTDNYLSNTSDDHLIEIPDQNSLNEVEINPMEELFTVKGDYVHWRYSTTAETTEFDKTSKEIANTIKKVDGYIENSDIYTNSEIDSFGKEHIVRRGKYTIRIPAESIDQLSETIELNSEIKQHTSSGEDLTESYLDTQTKIESLDKEYKKLENLLQSATEISDILAINDRLSEIEHSIDYNKKSMAVIKEDVDYATYYLTLDEVVYYEDVIDKYVSDTSEKWARTFKEWFSEVVPGALLAIITMIPFLVVIGYAVFYVAKRIFLYKEAYEKENFR